MFNLTVMPSLRGLADRNDGLAREMSRQVTLLLGNMIVNETLPILTEGVLGGGIQAVAISTILIVM